MEWRDRSTLSSKSALDEVGWSTPRASRFTARKETRTHCTWVWVGHRVGLDWCGNPRPHHDSIPIPSSPYAVAIPTELSWPTVGDRWANVYRVSVGWYWQGKRKYLERNLYHCHFFHCANKIIVPGMINVYGAAIHRWSQGSPEFLVTANNTKIYNLIIC